MKQTVSGNKGATEKQGLSRAARVLVGTLATVLLLCALIYAIGSWYKQRDYLPYFKARKSELVRADETLIFENSDYRIYDIRFEDAKGMDFMAHLKVPTDDGPRHPVIITLGGTDAGREVIEYLGDTRNWMILALDYPYRGPSDDLSHWEFVSILPQARRALLNTVPAGMMAVDYLYQRGDVDTERIVVAGGSFGALISPALAAAEERVSAVAILFGAGNLQEVIEVNLPLPEFVRPPVAWIGSVLVSPFEPLKYVGEISPRPIFFLNGTEDARMPEDISRAMHDAAGEPKTVTWLPLGHVNLGATEFHQQVLDACARWLQEIGFMAPEEVFILPDYPPD